jgi:hypothetical protein
MITFSVLRIPCEAMTRISPSNQISDYMGPAMYEQTGGSAGPESANLHGTIAALKTGTMEGKRRRTQAVIGQNCETTERLGRLRTELARISPRPETAHQAWTAILAAMARANLGDWTIPDLHGTSAVTFHDGSVRVNLIAHAIIFNPWGAFRIVNLRSDAAVYFELDGALQGVFVEPL